MVLKTGAAKGDVTALGITSASQGEFGAGLSLGGIFAVPPIAQSPLEIREKKATCLQQQP